MAEEQRGNFVLRLIWNEKPEYEMEHIAEDFTHNGDTPASRSEIDGNTLSLFYEDVYESDVEQAATSATQCGDDPANKYEIERT